jgi:hypothetical protein
MKQGDKFIVKVAKVSVFEVGEIVTYHSANSTNAYWHNFVNADGIEQFLTISQVDPLERFPCDDEQPNIE